jgi:hypothetical protein
VGGTGGWGGVGWGEGGEGFTKSLWMQVECSRLSEAHAPPP